MTTNEITAAQLAANQANALKSTGPRTEEGKAIARFNARRHGLTGQFYCMSDADEEAYRAFEADMLTDLRPSGPCETQIAVAIVQDTWRLNRSRATEFNLYGRGHDQRAGVTDAPTENTHAAATMADTHRDDHRVFANIALYETRLHRMIVRNEQRLTALRNERRAAEKEAREKAELLLRYADMLDEPISAVVPETEPQDVTDAPPACGMRGDRLFVGGFVFSPAEIIASMKREQLLQDAKICAAYGWDIDQPAIQRILKAA